MVDGVSSHSSGIRWRRRHYFRETEPRDGAAGLPSKCDTPGRFGTNLLNSYWLSEHKAETKGHGDIGMTVSAFVLQKLILISQRPCFTCREVPPSVTNLIKSQVYSLLHMRYSPIRRSGLRSFGLGRGDKYRVKKTSKYRVWKLAAAIM